MILKMLVSHPNVDVSYNPFLDGYVSSEIECLYNPNLDDSECPCKSSKSGCFVQSIFG